MLEPGSFKLLRGLRRATPQPEPQKRSIDNFFVQTIERIRSSVWLGIAVGGLLAGLGLLLRFALVGPTITKVPYVTFFPVIAMAAVLGGTTSGIAAIVFSAIILHWSFVPLVEIGDWINLMFFLGSNVLTMIIVEMLYRAQTRAIRAEAAKRALEWSAARHELLSKTATQLLQSPDPQSVIQELCREVMDFLDCDVFLHFLFDQRLGRLRLNAYAGVSKEEAFRIQCLGREGTIRGCVAADVKQVVAENVAASSDPCAALLEPSGVKSVCCLPLLEHQRVIGVLMFGDRARSGFDPATTEVMEAVSHLMSLALSRIRMEAALRESEERFSGFMRHFVGFAWVKDERGRYLLANEAVAKLAAKPLHMVLGRTDEELFGAEAGAALTQSDRVALESPSGLTTVEHFLDKSGTKRHYLVSKFPIPGGYEQKTCVGGIAIDDTKRVQAEERLQEATEKLREADRRKDEFLATLAHELRNPLAPIRSGLHVLHRTGGQGPMADKIQGMMERQVEHLVRLVDDLLEVSRISRGVIELRKEPLDLASVIHAAVETSRQLIDAGKLELRIDLPTEPLRLDADPVRLTQVVANLLNNAAKYTDPGGRIEVKAERQGDDAVVSVADTGIGIPPNMLPHVFDLFTQVDRTLGRAQGGLGIGLALVRNLVELHGGEVEALSDGEGKGSRFVVRLPLAACAVKQAAVRAKSEAEEAVVAKAPPRALVVDDTCDVADSLALLLKTLGAEVRVAYDGAQALEKFAEFDPEVVFLDISMPGMDGFETARRMRARPKGRNVTLIALTGWGEEKTRKLVAASGFDRHLIKPAQLGELKQALEFSDRRSLGAAGGGNFSAA